MNRTAASLQCESDLCVQDHFMTPQWTGMPSERFSMSIVSNFVKSTVASKFDENWPAEAIVSKISENFEEF